MEVALQAVPAAIGLCGDQVWKASGSVSFRSSEVFGRGMRCKRSVGNGVLIVKGGSSPVAVSSVLADIPSDILKVQETASVRKPADPKAVASLILGGGAGTRLFPLTMRRAKPAVPIGGGYRLIDVPMSNCINSGINKIYILTQFNSQSLNRHIARAYNSANGVHFGDGFVEVLAATQTPGESGKKWFQGTADAVRQFIWLFEDAKLSHIENILILSGDHLYRMDYMDFLQKHIDAGADISVSCIPMDDSRASDFGLMKIDKAGRICQFYEKPKGDSLKAMQVDTTVLGLTPEEAKKFPYIASMGIYIFKTDVLLNLLRWSCPNANDFGSEIIPMAAEKYDVQAYLFNDYWEDIGTIKSFFDANLALTDQPPRFEFYDHSKPIYTSPRFLPPTKYESCQISNSIISHGCFFQRCKVEHSLVGIRSRLEEGVELKSSVKSLPDPGNPTRIQEESSSSSFGKSGSANPDFSGEASDLTGSSLQQRAHVSNPRERSFLASQAFPFALRTKKPLDEELSSAYKRTSDRPLKIIPYTKLHTPVKRGNERGRGEEHFPLVGSDLEACRRRNLSSPENECWVAGVHCFGGPASFPATFSSSVFVPSFSSHVFFSC